MLEDNHTKHPEPAFQRFERVTILEGTARAELTGASGTIIWRVLVSNGSGATRRFQWTYIVFVPSQHLHVRLSESSIQSAGGFDREEMHWGEGCELSFDTIIEGHEKYIEGSYRLPGKFWEVFTLSKKDTIEIRHHRTTRSCGISRLHLQIPDSGTLDHSVVIDVLEVVLGVKGWKVVRGPDSMFLV